MKNTNKSKFDINSLLILKINKHIKIHIGVIILIISAAFFNYLDLFMISYLSAFIHEMGHIMMAKRLNVPIKYIEIQPFGIMARISDIYIKEPVKEAVISLTGPVISLFLSVILMILNIYIPHSTLNYAAGINAGLFLINLIPCLPLDGGRIFKAAITDKYGIITAYNFMTQFSKAVLICMLFFLALLLITLNFNFSFILILAFLMGNISSEYKAISIITMKEIIYNKQKLYENDTNKVKTAAAYETMPARFVLRKLSYNYYYIINVINDNQEIVNTLTETQIIDGIINKGIGILLKDIT